MAKLLNIEIAGVNFVISCKDSVTLQNYNPIYSSFLVTKNSPTNADINISIEINNFPDIKKQTKIFDSGQSWSMLQNGNNYFLVMNHHAFDKKPIWVARFDHNFKNVCVFLREKLLHESTERITIPNFISYPLDQILLMYLLAQREGALIHAAGAEYNGKGYIFPGKSGAGKSTLTKQLDCINDFFILSDDRVVVRKIENIFKVFGTPWPGEAGIAVNSCVDLSGIFFVSQARSNKIIEIDSQKALEKLLPVVSIPWYDKETMIKILDFCGDLISHIPTYDFQFKPGSEAIHVFESFITQ